MSDLFDFAENESPYPELSGAVDRLKRRLEDDSARHKALLEKWVIELQKIDKEMRHLERLENFTNALTSLEDDEAEGAE